MLLPLLLALSTQVPDTAHIIVVSTTDVHGHATDWDYLADAPFPGGLARAATVVDSLRRRYPGQVVLLDVGDLIQGDPFAAFFAQEAVQDPHPLLDVMGAMGYDAATPGNHDFDWGVPFMFRAFRGAAFPYVSGNVYTLPADTLAFPAYIVVRRNGVRVGVTGFTTPGVMLWDREHVRGAARVASIGGSAERVLRLLSASADLRIVLMHSGMPEASSSDTAGVGPENIVGSLAQGPANPDLVIVGHSHREMADSVINGVHFVQPKHFSQSLSVVHITMQRSGAGWRPQRMRAQLVPLGQVAPATMLTRRLQMAHEAVRRWVAQLLGTALLELPATTARVEPSAIVNYINEVQRRRAGTELAATPVFDTRAGFKAGEITLAHVAALYPYENTLRGIRITGAQLKAYLEQSARYFTVNAQGRITLNDSIPGYNFDIVSGAEYAIDLRLPPGSRIRGLSVRGRPVEPADQFTMAVNSHRQAGGGGFAMLAGSPVVYDRGENIRDLLVEDLLRRGTLAAEDFGARNWQIVPEEAARAARRLFAPTPDPVRPPLPRDTTLLRIFAIGDFHGALLPKVESWSNERPVGGMPAIKRLMDSLTRQCACPDFRVDAGDEMQGTLPSNLEFGRSTVAAMNLLGLDAAAVGNHDFDWGVDTLLQRMAEARYPWLVSNLVDSTSGQLPNWAIPYQIIPAGRLRVGVIGYLTPETNTIVRGDILAGLRIEGPSSFVAQLGRLRAEQPDLIVVLAHEGAECAGSPSTCSGPIIDLARQLDSGSVDLIVAGHRHQLGETRVNGIPIVQAGSGGRTIAVVDVVKTLIGSREVRSRLVTVYADSIGADTAMQSLVERFRIRSDSLGNRVVATLKVPMPRSGEQYPLGNLIADAVRNALRTDFAVMNSGGIRTGLPSGAVTYAQIFEVSPFQNELIRVRLTGRDLRRVLEEALRNGQPSIHISGLNVTYDRARPLGRRVRDVRLPTGRRLDDRTTYALAINEYLAGGKEGFGMLASLTAERSGVLDVDAIVAYLRRLPQPVEPPVGERFVLVR